MLLKLLRDGVTLSRSSIVDRLPYARTLTYRLFKHISQWCVKARNHQNNYRISIRQITADSAAVVVAKALQKTKETKPGANRVRMKQPDLYVKRYREDRHYDSRCSLINFSFTKFCVLPSCQSVHQREAPDAYKSNNSFLTKRVTD